MERIQLIQNTPEWYEWRRSGVGASEVPALIGADIYKNTPYSVWRVKTKRSKGFEGNSFTEHGKLTEGKARAAYELIEMDDMPEACGRHPVYKHCLASFDGIRADGKLILEIKCPTGLSVIEAAEANRVADHYIPQVQFQLAVSGADLAHFFVYHSETGRYAKVDVKPDIEMQGRLIVAVEDFWAKYIVTDTPPPLMDIDAKDCADNADILDICKDIVSNGDKWTKKEMDEVKARVMKYAGHPIMECGRVRISTVLRAGKFSYHKLTIRPEAASV